MALATRNAEEHLAREQARWLADQGKTLAALEELAEALGLPGPPLRIECYDISQLPGRGVGRQHGRVRGRQAADRRVPPLPDPDGRGPERLRQPPGGPAPPVPGRPDRRGGQRGGAPLGDARPRHRRRRQGPGSAAKEVLDELGLHDLPLAGLAKEREELFLPGRSDPIVLPPTSSALYLVQRLRDEAHRFAITYHRALRERRRSARRSTTCPASGPKRRRELLRVFGSIKRVREAPVEQIAAVPGIGRALAERIKATLEA